MSQQIRQSFWDFFSRNIMLTECRRGKRSNCFYDFFFQSQLRVSEIMLTLHLGSSLLS